MGWNEWPLILFTVLAQSAVGAYWFTAPLILAGMGDLPARNKLERSMILIWILMALAFLCSMAHLGSPFKAANALLRLGQAPLSNEVFFGSAFIACGGMAWLVAWRKIGSQALHKVLHGIALILSMVFLWNMSNFYMMPTVPTWNTPLTPLAFLVTTILAGAIIANLLFSISGFSSKYIGKAVTVGAVLALLAGAVIAIALASMLPEINSSIHQAGLLSKDMGGLQALRFLLITIAVGLLVYQIVDNGHALPVAVTSAILVVAGEMVGRGVFYALHMTVGLI